MVGLVARCLLALTVLAIPLAASAQSEADMMRGLLGGAKAAAAQANPLSRGIRPTVPRDVEPPNPPARQPSAALALRPAASRPAAPRTPAPAPTAIEVGSLDLYLPFDSGSDRLTPAARNTLEKLGRVMTSPELAGSRFRIIGHTDTVGSRALNEQLSARRAATVAEFLATAYRVDHARLVTVGMGSAQPLVPTGDNVPEPRNRRVQVVNEGP